MRTRSRWIISMGLLGIAGAFAIAGTVATPTSGAGVPATPTRTAPEEAATIHDDPTVAPDSQESADNAVTFPSDI